MILIDMENYLECPITKMIMSEPVFASDGHIYEKTAIVRWLSEDKRSPVTRESLDGRLYPAIAHRNMISEYLMKNPDLKQNLFVPVKTCAEYKDKINLILKQEKFRELLEYSKFDLSLLDKMVLYNFLKKCDDAEILEHFIDQQLDLDGTDQHGRTLLHLLCYLSGANYLNYLLDNYLVDVDIEVKDENESRPIHFACQSGDIEKIKILIDHHAKVDVANRWGVTPLHYIFQGVKKISDHEIDILVNNGASFDIVDAENKTPIGWAFQTQEMDTILHMMDKLKNHNIRKEEMGLLFQNPNLEISEIAEILRFLTKLIICTK